MGAPGPGFSLWRGREEKEGTVLDKKPQCSEDRLRSLPGREPFLSKVSWGCRDSSSPPGGRERPFCRREAGGARPS